MKQSSPSLAPRLLAVEILTRVGRQRYTLDHWLQWADTRHQNLLPRDRAFVRSIVYGTLRWQGRLDWIIDHFAARKAKSIHPLVRTILRLGLFQLLYLDRVPASAAVNTSVEMAKQLKRPWASGFINKILRRAALESGHLIWPNMDIEPEMALSVGQSFPRWMISRWIQRLGIEQTKRLCLAFNTIAPTTLRTNSLKIHRTELLTTLKEAAEEVRPTLLAPDGIVMSNLKMPLVKHPAFHRGWFQIQDEAAQLVSLLLDPHPGQTVWDACAGLGTKTAHLAQLMKNQGRLFASDRNTHKLNALSKEMLRLGVTVVDQLNLDLHNAADVRQLPLFDRILLDAPCSGMGVIRKNPDTKWSLAPNDLRRLHRQQIVFLDRVAGQLKPGGILVYSVCSMEPEETQDVMEEFLRMHPEFDIYHETADPVIRVKDLMTAEHWLSTTPNNHDMDGFFAAALKKNTVN